MKFRPKSETTRQFIIESTADIFNKKGYAGTSLSDLTEATKLTKGSIYGNFENKEEVAIAAFEYNLARRISFLTEHVNNCKTYREKLLMHIELFDGASRNMLIYSGCPIMNTVVDADDILQRLHKKAALGLMRWKSNLNTIIKKGIEAKEFRSDIDINKMALSILALIEGAILMGKASKNTKDISAILDTARELVYNMCLKIKS